MSSFPGRGSVYLLDINPVSGATAETPVVVVQNDIGNEFSRTIIVALVEPGAMPGFDLDVELSQEETGLETGGVVHTDSIFTVDRGGFTRHIGRLTPASIGKLNEALTISLGLLEF